MSLRQLKFKPKLRPAAKKDETSNISSAKEVCNEHKPTSAVNPCSNNLPGTEKVQEPVSEKILSKNIHIPTKNITHKRENSPTSRILIPDSTFLPNDLSNSEFNHSKETNQVSATTPLNIPLDLSPIKCSRIHHQNPNLELLKTNGEFIPVNTSINAQEITNARNVSQVLMFHEEKPDLNESTKNMRDEGVVAKTIVNIPNHIDFNICAKKVSRVRKKPNLQLSNKVKDGSGNFHNKSQKKLDENIISIKSNNEDSIKNNEPIKTFSEDAIVTDSTTATYVPHVGLDICAKTVSPVHQKPNLKLSEKAKDVSEDIHYTSLANEDVVKVSANENETKTNFNDFSPVNTKSSITKAEPNLSALPEQKSDEAFAIEITPSHIVQDLGAKKISPSCQNSNFGMQKKIKDVLENICNSTEKLIGVVSVDESMKNVCDDTITIETSKIIPTEPTVFNVCAKKVSRIRQKPNFGVSKKSKAPLENTINNPHPKKTNEDIVSKLSAYENKTNLNDSSLVNTKCSIISTEPKLCGVPEEITYPPIHQNPNLVLSKRIKDVSENICNSAEKLIDEDVSKLSVNESTNNLCNGTITVEMGRISPTEPTVFNVCAKKVSRIRQKPNFGLSKKSKDVLKNTFKHPHSKKADEVSVNENKTNFNDSSLVNKSSSITEMEVNLIECSEKLDDEATEIVTGITTDIIPENACNSSQQKSDEINLKVPFNQEKPNLNEVMKNLSDDPSQIKTNRTDSSSLAFDVCAKKVSRISKKPNLGSSKNYDRAVPGNAFNIAQQLISKDIVSLASINEEKNNSNKSGRKLDDNEMTIETGRTTPPVIGFDLSPKKNLHIHYKPNVELVTNDHEITSKNAHNKNDEEKNVSVTKETFNFSDSERNLSGDGDSLESGRTTPTQIGFDLSPKKVFRFQHKSNDDDNVFGTTLTENHEKKDSRKKNVSKIANHSSNKLTSPQKGNFKPNLATLGKIKRPDKFASSSFSKMETKAKQQLFKKFGKIEEIDSSKLTMMDLIFYNPKSNPMSQNSDKQLVPNEQKNTEKAEEKKPKETTVTEKSNSTSVDTNKSDDILPVPQLKISADGKVIVAQESVVILPSHNLENATFEDVIDGDFSKRKPMKNPNRCGWSHQDTIKFYKALNSLGCDFETMQSIFPDRSRRNLKSKFKKEEKLHGSLINKVLSRHSEFDLSNVVRELEIDTVYQNTIKNYGRDLGTENEKRAKGRKKSISSIIAGKSPEKDDEESDDGPFIDGEFSIRKRKTDAVVISKLSNVLGLNDSNNSVVTEVENQSSKSFESNKSKLSNLNDSSIQVVGNILSKSNVKDPLSNSKPNKRKRRKAIKYVESDSDDDYESQYLPNTKRLIIDQSNGIENVISPKPTRTLRKRKPPTNKNFVLSLEDLINLGIENEAEKTSDNHIVINTNIEFENVKYTRYISYNSNNLENPIEINETVAHVD